MKTVYKMHIGESRYTKTDDIKAVLQCLSIIVLLLILVF